MTPAASTGATVKACEVSPATVTIAAGARSHSPRHGLRSHVTWPSRAGSPAGPTAPGQVGADRLRAGEPARDVVADVGNDRRPRVRGEEGVERRDAIRLGGSDGESLADVVERRGADPADPRLDAVECRDQQRAAGPRCVAAARRVSVDATVARAADPTRFRRPEHGVHGCPFRRGREGPDDMQIHRVESSHNGSTGSRPRVVRLRRRRPGARRSASIVRRPDRPACPRRRSGRRRDPRPARDR